MVTGDMLKLIEGFHHREARRIAEMTAQRTNIREWGWNPVADVLETSGIWPIN